MFLCCERHAEIDRKPGTTVLIADPVYRKIHTDLADPAERRKYQFF
jgi:hypothetical protein